MTRKLWFAAPVLALGFAVVAANAQQMPPDMPMRDMPARRAAAPAGPLHIAFADHHSEWTPATLAPLPHVTVTVLNHHTKANQTFSGVPLFALLTALGLPEKPHGKDFHLYIVATGSDGYEVVFSLAEIVPAIHEGTVLVADSVDGKPLQATGPLQLVATGDKLPERSVRNLVSIDVRAIQ